MKSLTIAVLLVCTAMAFEGGYGQDRSCINSLIPCLNYLNGTRNPPESCCNPLRSVIRSNSDCLCSLISREGSRRAEQAGIDINDAQQLPARCGEHVNPLSCLTSRNSLPLFMISGKIAFVSKLDFKMLGLISITMF